MSQDGGDPISAVVSNLTEELSNNLLRGDLANAAVQVGTLGTAGLKDGQFSKGVMAQALDEGLGEISGRNVARAALNDQRDALRQEKVRKEQVQREEQERKRKMDVQASLSAQRSTVTGKGVDELGDSDLLGERDFLGL